MHFQEAREYGGNMDIQPATSCWKPADLHLAPGIITGGSAQSETKVSRSDYIVKFDQSPYYTWAAFPVSRMMDFEGYEDLLDHLKSARDRLDYHYQLYYSNKKPARTSQLPEASSSQQKRSPQKDIAGRDRLKERALIDETQQ
ncbi:hypothetical protein B0H14DRAFT_2559487 [Mycena olivaceomarginata]|nr:hypothetical protein B0H14DRAFT_2559487 [Mycena olivaceomarginata]